MKVDKLKGLFRALDRSAERSDQQAELQKQAGAETKTSSEAVQVDVSKQPELSSAERAQKVAELKAQYEQGTLRPVESEKVATALLRDLF